MTTRTAAGPSTGPLLLFTAANLVRTTGAGLLLTLVPLYFTRSAGLSVVQVGVGLSIGAAVALAAGLPAGRIADAWGTKPATLAFTGLHGASVAGYVVAGDMTGFVVVTSLVLALEAASGTARAALVAAAFAGPERVRARAYMRVASNIGVSAGAAAAGVALYADSATGYRVLYVACGVSIAASALLFLRLRTTAPPPRPEGGRAFAVLRDRPYLAVTALNGVLSAHDAILTVALPLWIATRTEAPPWVYAAVVVLNTVLVVLLQVPLSRSAGTLPGASRALVRSGALLAAGCLVFAAAADRDRPLAVALLAAGALAHVVGEILHSAGSWELAYDLAPEHAQGEYQGMFGTGLSLAGVVMPLVASVVLVSWGLPGWVLVALVLCGAGLATPATVRWAERERAAGVARTAAAAHG